MTGASNTSSNTSWTESYRGIPGVYDEFVDAKGTMRPHWEALTAKLEAAGSEVLQSRWEAAQRELISNGIAYNPASADKEAPRPWVLDAIPLVIPEREWEVVAAGIEQRARLFDLILADIYGPQRLVRDRLLPPDAVFNNPKYFPALHDVHGPSASHLHLYAADLARAADGQWWVANDHTRAPLGLGFLLENRLATSRLVAGIYDESFVHRLAPFFGTYRAALLGLSVQHRDEPRVVLWTPGPSSPSYFEDAYLARYLGFALAESGDLAVRNNHVVLKTLRGLLPVDVLVRRLDDERCDGLELAGDSTHGISGLLEVVRAGNVAVSSPLGTSIAESPVLLPYLRELCKVLLGEDLHLPDVATWWCGDPVALDHVLDRLDDLMIRPAFGDSDSAPKFPAQMSDTEKLELRDRIRSQPERFVAQDMVAHSTSPVWNGGQVEPWYFGLRAYAAATSDGHTILQGGLARVSPQPGFVEFSLGEGMRSQDVWILSDQEVENATLLPPPDRKIELRRGGSDLPSRVADNLYWLGRNMERAEQLVRLERVALRMIAGEFDAEPVSRLVHRLAQGRETTDFDTAPVPLALPETSELIDSLLLGPSGARSIRSSINEAVRLAASVRDRLAVAMWRSVQRTRTLIDRLEFARARGVSSALEALDTMMSEINVFSGLTAESMTRTEGWRFLHLGRRLERALQVSTLLRCALVAPIDNEQVVMEALLNIGDSVMTYRVRYLSSLQVPALLDLMLSDESNPRSLAHQLAAVHEHVDWLPHATHSGILGPDQRLALAMVNSVQLADVFKLSQIGRHGRRERLYRLLSRIETQVPKLSDILSGQYLVHAGLPRHFSASVEEPR